MPITPARLVALLASLHCSIAAADGGHCDTPAPVVAPQKWQHPFHAKAVLTLGAPNHRVRDLVLPAGQKGARLRGHFTYGETDKDLEREQVEVWLRRCPAWERVATLTTDHDGVVWADVPADLAPGDYRVRMIVAGDGSFAEGTIAVWPPGVQAIVSDIDGTLTTSDGEMFRDLTMKSDAKMYPDANSALRALAQKGYRIVYLSGRAQYVNRYTRDWLGKHDFPPGPLLLTEERGEVAPTIAGVGAFKKRTLVDLQQRVGVKFVSAYGNASTDVWAYGEAGLDKARTFIIGKHAGEAKTVALASYTEHLKAIEPLPAAKQP